MVRTHNFPHSTGGVNEQKDHVHRGSVFLPVTITLKEHKETYQSKLKAVDSLSFHLGV